MDNVINVVTVPSSEEESRADEIVHSIESVSVSKETKMTYAQSLFVVTVNGFAVVFVFDQFDLLSLSLTSLWKGIRHGQRFPNS